jgi:hypothetical protein
MKSSLRALVALSVTTATAALTGACEAPELDEGAGGARAGEVSVSVAPLTLDGVADACYTLTVRNADGAVVWSQPGVCSSAYGDGRGDVTYVGTCDAERNLNTVELSLEGLFDANGAPLAGVRNPCADGACVRTFECVENADASVAFELTVLRDLGAGFVDVTVDFDEIFCSAKADCIQGLLHDPQTGERLPTLVLGLACHAGGESTTLHRTPLVLTCPGGSTWVFDPAATGPGGGPVMAQAAYIGAQSEPEGTAYWNIALGLASQGFPGGCTLTAMATASDGPLQDGLAPPDYPVIALELPLSVDPNGEWLCENRPLGAPGGGLTVVYPAISTKFDQSVTP